MTTGGLHKPWISAPNVVESVARHVTERFRGPDQGTVGEVEIYDDARGCMVDGAQVYLGARAHHGLCQDGHHVELGGPLPLGNGPKTLHPAQWGRKPEGRYQIRQVDMVRGWRV